MFGESGTSHTGKLHTYYCCYNRKRRKGCEKKSERREDLETFIVAQTMEYILTPVRMNRIAKAVVVEYNKEFSGSRVEEMEKALAQIDREMDKLVDALIDAPKAAHKKIYARMEALEAQKAEFETDAAKLRVAMGLRLTEKEVVSWLKTFRDGDPSDDDFRRRLVDIFINAVYAYDDRIIVFYNIRGGKQVSNKDLYEALESPQDKENSKPETGSDLESSGGEDGIRTHVPFPTN